MNYKKYWRLLLVAIVAGFASCNEDNPITLESEFSPEMFTATSNSTLVNTKMINIGNVTDDTIFEMYSTILTTSGKVNEYTLNVCGMAAVSLKDGAQDQQHPVTNATLINKGTITIHTRDLVEAYKDQIQTPDDLTRKYKYLRVIGLYAGDNSTVINDGVINVYFDHDPDFTGMVYVMGLVSGDGSTVINNGEINFYGTGTVTTRMRGVATFADNIKIENHGLISADVQMADDSRAITTGGTFSDVYNDGTIRLRLGGTVCCITRYGNTKIVNEGLIDITSTSVPEEYDNGSNKMISALYEPLTGSRNGMPAMINRGTIVLTMDNTAPADPNRMMFGMLFDLQAPGGEIWNVNIINEGKILVNNPGKYMMCEACFMGRPTSAAGVCTITMGTWKTRLRDFTKKRDMFNAMGVNMDFSKATLLLEADEDYVPGTAYSIAPEAIMTNMGGTTYRYEYSGYDEMDVQSATEGMTLVWDKAAKTAALQ